MDRARFEYLLERYSDGLATPAELHEFTVLLKQNPEFRKALVERNSLEVLMHDVIATQATADRPSVRVQVTATRRAKRKIAWTNSWTVPMGIAAAVMLVVAIYFLQPKQTPPVAQTQIAQIKLATGTRLVRGNETLTTQQNATLIANDTLLTSETGTTDIVYADGTRMTVAPNSQIKLLDTHGSKWVQLESGDVSATVSKQPAGKPMTFATADARAQVVGTALRFAKRGEQTRLEVSEGLVQMQRLSDGKTVDVKAGQVAVAAAGKEFVAEALPVATAPSTTHDPKLIPLGKPVVNETFENGQMEGWVQAKVVSGGADGSRHALEATFQAQQSPAIIFSAVKLPASRLPGGVRNNEWLFENQSNLVVQFSYFIEGQAGPIRVQGFNNQQDDNFNAVFENPVVGRWATAQIRLDSFKHNDSKRAEESLRPGTHFRSLQFYPPASTGNASKFLIDNIVVAPADGPAR